jgi:hypothetical protein
VDPSSNRLVLGLTPPTLVLIAVASLITLMTLIQHFGERLLLHGIFAEPILDEQHRSFNALISERIGADVELMGGARAWLLSGRVVLRNVVLRSPTGYRADPLLTVRCVSAYLGVQGLLRALLTRRVDVLDLRVEGINIVAEEHEAVASMGPGQNLQSMLQRLEAAAAPRSVQDTGSLEVVVESVVIQGSSIRRLRLAEVGGSLSIVGHASTPERRFEKFSKEMRVGTSADNIVVALAKTVASDALSSIG